MNLASLPGQHRSCRARLLTLGEQITFQSLAPTSLSEQNTRSSQTTRGREKESTVMHSDLPTRPKSRRIVNKTKAEKPLQYFQFKRRFQNITNINDLLPGLNDISDAFEAMPMDLVKYFTLLKEIDAKCIKTIPLINHNIDHYIDKLHVKLEDAPAQTTKIARLQRIRKQIHEVIPCLEEKMHVTSVAADVLAKHMYRINNDYRVIVGNNEIPESVRMGPLNHRAMILDPQAAAEAAKSAQSQRSETRREALAARKAHRDDDDDTSKKHKNREPASLEASATNGNAKKRRKERETEKIVVPTLTERKKTASKPRKEKETEPSKPASTGVEPTYCYCNQISFGEMVGCDGDTCEREWFHLPCIGFKNPPKGKWYCDDCLVKVKKTKK